MGNSKGLSGNRRRRKRPEKQSLTSKVAAGEKEQSPKMSRRRKWLFRLTAMIFIPALFLLLLESSLRLTDYGYPTGFFSKIEDLLAFTGNYRFSWRFFPRVMARVPEPMYLPQQKPEGTYRIFILGASAAQGTPRADFNFGRILEVMLEEQFPNARFEVINVAMTAINSHVVLPIARDCARHDGDLFIIYLGNNEVVGPFGPGTVFAGYSPSLSVIRLSLAFKTTRIGQLLENIMRRLATKKEPDEGWGEMEMFVANQVPADDPRLEKTYAHFRENLLDMCRTITGSGAQALLCTVATNLKDNAPFASEHRPGLNADEKSRWEALYSEGVALESANRFEDAVHKYTEAVLIDDRFADLHFRLGRSLLASGQYEKIREHYLLARDLDALRFRADTWINTIIRQVAEEQAVRGVHLADVENAFATNEMSVHGIPGRELFYEHVHMTFEGNYLTAKTLYEQIVDLLPDSITRNTTVNQAPPSCDRCAERLALTDWERYEMVSTIFAMTGKPPFTKQLDHAQIRARQSQYLTELAGRITPESFPEIVKVYLAAVEQKPDDWRLRKNYAAILLKLRDYPGAIAQYRRILERYPHLFPVHIYLGNTLLGQGNVREAVAHYREATRLMPNYGLAHSKLANALVQQNQYDEAIQHYQLALQSIRYQSDTPFIQCNLANTLSLAGRNKEAIAYYQLALESYTGGNAEEGRPEEEPSLDDREPTATRPSAPSVRSRITFPASVHGRLGVVLEAEGQLAEAVDHYQQAIQLSPEAAELYNDLGAFYFRQEEWESAVAIFRKALEINPEYRPAQVNLQKVARLSTRGTKVGS